MLPNLRIASRCSAGWGRIRGEGRVRSSPAHIKGIAALPGTILLAFLQAGSGVAQSSSMLTSSSTKIGQSAQTGTFSATVKDAAGGVIVHASVALITQAGVVAIKSQTDALGEVHMRGLAPGSYSVKIETKGFRTFLLKDVSVPYGGDVENEITLQVAPIIDDWPGSGYHAEIDVPVVIRATDFSPLPLAPVPTVPHGPKQNRVRRLLTRIRTKF
jgi:carboxypeptidase family protein